MPRSRPQGATFTGVEGNSTGTALLATFTDAGGALPASAYTATVNWGDGTTSNAAVTATGLPDGVTYQVSGAHVYARAGTYQATVTIADQDGAIALAHAGAAIGEAALTPAVIQPLMNMTEAVPFLGEIAAFADANPASTPADFAAVINWGDGSPLTLGAISQPGGPGTAYIVGATHTYADSGVDGGTGHYPILVNVVDTGGARTTVAGTANVADVPIVLGGQLDPASDHGLSNSDGVTNVNQPTFTGMTQGGAVVKLFAQPSGGGPLMAIGQAGTDASGAWKITSAPLPDGSYNILATTVDAAGNTTATATLMPNAKEGPLVIDTVAPRVSNVVFDVNTGRYLVSFQDDRSGMDTYSIVDPSNFSLVGSGGVSLGSLTVQNATGPQGVSPTFPQSVGLTLGNGGVIPAGLYQLTASSASPVHTSGITDLAGNALDGEFLGNFPSGNGHPGGDFTITLPTTYSPVVVPVPVVPGPVVSTPVVSTPAVTPTIKHHALHSKPARVSHPHAVHDAALAQVKVPRKGH